MVRGHEERERPFDPSQPPTWRGSAHDLVANPVPMSFRGPVELYEFSGSTWHTCGRFPNVRAAEGHINGGSSSTIYSMQPIGVRPGEEHNAVYRLNPGGFADDVRELVHRYYGKLRTDASEEELTSELIDALKNRRTSDALEQASELLEGFGVEALGPNSDPLYLYINFGDTYDPTIMWSRIDNKIIVAMGGWGSVWEDEGEQASQEDAWHDYLHREFSGSVRRQLDNYTDTPEGERDLDRFDELTSEDEYDLFEQALREAQEESKSTRYPEWIMESEGYALTHVDVVVNKAVELVQGGWQPKRLETNRPKGGRGFDKNPGLRVKKTVPDPPDENAGYKLGLVSGRQQYAQYTWPKAVAQAKREAASGSSNALRLELQLLRWGPDGQQIDALEFPADEFAAAKRAAVEHVQQGGNMAELRGLSSRLFAQHGFGDRAHWNLLTVEPEESGALRSNRPKKRRAPKKAAAASATPKHTKNGLTREMEDAIKRSRVNGGMTIKLYRFSYEDEVSLGDEATDAKELPGVDGGFETTVYSGPGWRVELVGDGDPR
jgi:hypothetical protein